MSRFHQCVVRARAALKAAEVVAQFPIFAQLRHHKGCHTLSAAQMRPADRPTVCVMDV